MHIPCGASGGGEGDGVNGGGGGGCIGSGGDGGGGEGGCVESGAGGGSDGECVAVGAAVGAAVSVTTIAWIEAAPKPSTVTPSVSNCVGLCASELSEAA